MFKKLEAHQWIAGQVLHGQMEAGCTLLNHRTGRTIEFSQLKNGGLDSVEASAGDAISFLADPEI